MVFLKDFFKKVDFEKKKKKNQQIIKKHVGNLIHSHLIFTLNFPCPQWQYAQTT